MDYAVTPAQAEFGRAFEDFCQRTIAPRAAQVDRDGELSRANWDDLAGMGWFGLYVDKAWGGTAEDVDWVMRALAEESLAKACAATFLSAGASVGLCGAPIQLFGSEALKARWLPGLASGATIGCFGLTEPDAGTDAASLRTRAERVDGGWRLHGEKALITNAPIADVCVVMAVTDPDAGHAGVTAFAVDLAGEGIARTAAYRKLGLRGSPTGGLVFDGAFVPDDAVVGTVGAGFLQAMQTLELGRISMSHFGIGIAEAAFDAASRYAVERKAFGKPIATRQAVHFKLADMKIEIDAARLMARKAAWAKASGQPAAEYASIAKLYATEMAVRCADRAVQVFGGWGYTDDFPVERLLRDARLGPIGEGTSEIQRELIARHLLDV
ncbi:MAG: acyl-CoA dehydrogenase family protein [Alphaproteobacteria bacterium]|nr:acyl-CoA dehydrogenase family protein [Alphaproteobacteria bacterium]